MSELTHKETKEVVPHKAFHNPRYYSKPRGGSQFRCRLITQQKGGNLQTTVSRPY